MATKIFGEMLHCPQTDYVTEFPSPESLKNKIVISTKPPKENPQSDSISKLVSNGSESSEEESWGLELPDSVAQLKTEDTVREIKHACITSLKKKIRQIYKPKPNRNLNY